MAVRRIAYLVLVLLVVIGIWLGAGGDGRMRLFTAALFGSCALSLAWKLWSSRGEAATPTADPPPPPPVPDPDPAPDPDEAAPGGPWKVYGYDRFSYEDYFVGAFDTEAEAREVARQKEEHLAKFQDESLRDRIWVEPPNSRYRLSLED
ncbi:MAG TPA: hypothetical protein VHG08_00250 [Longimicrobium sp.]|nr:hypothetical protein [Longimicrobium sp.]